MIRTTLILEVRPGHAEPLVAVFREHGILTAAVAQPGCHSAEIGVTEDGSEAVVTATWEDADAYAVWTSRPDRTAMAEVINPHLRVPLGESTVGRVYRIGYRPELPEAPAATPAG